MLYQEGLVHFLDRRRVLADRGADVVQTDGTTLELLDDRFENSRIHVVEAELVDVDHAKKLGSDVLCDYAIGLHLRVVAYASQKAIGDAGRSAGATRDLVRSTFRDLDVQHHR